MVITRHDHVERAAGNHFAVVRTVGLNHGDHKIRPIGARCLGGSNRSVDRIQKYQITRTGHFRRGVLCHRNNRYLEVAIFLQHHPAKTGHRRAVGIGDVDRRPRIVRCGHLFQKVINPEVKFVVARNRDIERHQIGQVDGVLALVKARQNRWAEHVAVKDIKHVWIGGAFCQSDGVQARKAAAPIFVRKIINVANAQNGQFDLFGNGRRDCGCGKDAGSKQKCCKSLC